MTIRTCCYGAYYIGEDTQNNLRKAIRLIERELLVSEITISYGRLENNVFDLLLIISGMPRLNEKQKEDMLVKGKTDSDLCHASIECYPWQRISESKEILSDETFVRKAKEMVAFIYEEYPDIIIHNMLRRCWK